MGVSFARRLLSSVSFASFVPFFFYLLCPFSFLGILLFGSGPVVVVVFAFAPSSSSTPSKAQSVIPDSVWAQAAFAAIFVARCHTWLRRSFLARYTATSPFRMYSFAARSSFQRPYSMISAQGAPPH